MAHGAGTRAPIGAAAIDFGASRAAAAVMTADGPALASVGLFGVSAGAEPDADVTVRALRIALDQVEASCETAVTRATMVVSGPGVSGRIIRAVAPLNGALVDEGRCRAVVAAACAKAKTPGRQVLHAVPVGYQVDAGQPIADPRGLIGARLSADVCVVTAPEALITAARACAAEAGVHSVEPIAAPFAAGFGALSADALDTGAVVVDLGAGATGVSVFAGGLLLYADSIPIAGAHLTRLIAERLGAPFAAAERLKRAHACLTSRDGPRLTTARLDEDGRLQPVEVARAALAEAIAPGVAALLGAIKASLSEALLPDGAHAWPVALVGGGASLKGIEEAASAALGRTVWIAKPIGLAEPAGASHAALAGALARANAGPSAEAYTGQAAPADPRFGARNAARRGLMQAWGWLKANI